MKSGLYAFSDAELWLRGVKCLATEEAGDIQNASIGDLFAILPLSLILGNKKC